MYASAWSELVYAARLTTMMRDRVTETDYIASKV